MTTAAGATAVMAKGKKTPKRREGIIIIAGKQTINIIFGEGAFRSSDTYLLLWPPSTNPPDEATSIFS